MHKLKENPQVLWSHTSASKSTHSVHPPESNAMYEVRKQCLSQNKWPLQDRPQQNSQFHSNETQRERERERERETECVCVCVCVCTQLCLTFCDPKDCSLPGSWVHGILLARILEWVVISFFRGSFWPRHGTRVSVSPALQADSLPLSHQGSPPTYKWMLKKQSLLWEALGYCSHHFFPFASWSPNHTSKEWGCDPWHTASISFRNTSKLSNFIINHSVFTSVDLWQTLINRDTSARFNELFKHL